MILLLNNMKPDELESWPRPLVTSKIDKESHLKTIDKLTPQMQSIVEKEKPGLMGLIVPSVLEGTNLAIEVRKYILNEKRYDILTFEFSIFKKNEQRDLGSPNLKCVYEIKKGDAGLVVQGTGVYANDTKHQPDNSQYTEVTLLLSPVDDALAQAMANHYQANVTRAVRTDYKRVK